MNKPHCVSSVAYEHPGEVTMDKVLQLLVGSWTGQSTLFIMLYIVGMMRYFVYLFLKHAE